MLFSVSDDRAHGRFAEWTAVHRMAAAFLVADLHGGSDVCMVSNHFACIRIAFVFLHLFDTDTLHWHHTQVHSAIDFKEDRIHGRPGDGSCA